MTDFYEIIKDRTLLQEFINWLPDLQENEKFYVCLFSRRKWVKNQDNIPHSSADKNQLKRYLTNKERFVEKIEQLECKYGAYKWHGNPIPYESMGLYITANPRNLETAQLNSIMVLAKCVKNKHKHANPHQEVMSEIHRTPSKKSYLLFDIDNTDKNLIKKCIDIVDGYCTVIRTRGGYHLHVHLDKAKNIKEKYWHNKISEHSDVLGDELTPVVGCCQGGFTPYFYYKDGKFK